MTGVRDANAGVVQTAGGVAQLVSDIVICDSFEDQDMAEWSTTDWSFVTTDVVDGTYAIENNSFEDGGTTPGDGLDNYYARGDGELRFFHRIGAVSDYFYFGFGYDGTDAYEIRHEWGTDEFLVRNTASGTDFGYTSSVGWDATHYVTQVIWDDGSLGGSAGDIQVITSEWDNTNRTIGTEYVNVSFNDDNGGLDTAEGFLVTAPGTTPVTLDYIHYIP